jgi:hypothetical protein
MAAYHGSTDFCLTLFVSMKRHGVHVRPHDFWIHFACGLVVGAFVGVCVGAEFSDGVWAMVGTALLVALITACSCGHWGDEAWEVILSLF